MELLPIYPDDIPRGCREFAATLEQNSTDSRWSRLTALAVADLFEMLEHKAGPTKWVRLNHFQTLSFFAFEQRENPRQHPQVVVHCGPPHEASLIQVKYLLPIEQRPWTWPTTSAPTIAEAANLVLDGLARSEYRREYLVEDT